VICFFGRARAGEPADVFVVQIAQLSEILAVLLHEAHCGAQPGCL
jgi:hypothetical protein